mgnify:CR=1 FL=1
MMVLFLVFFQIGLFSVGGGYAAMPLIQSLVVESHGWLTMAEFTNLMTIAEMTPGPIAVNSATFVGMRCAGLPGALVATFGCITPSLIPSRMAAPTALPAPFFPICMGDFVPGRRCRTCWARCVPWSSR